MSIPTDTSKLMQIANDNAPTSVNGFETYTEQLMHKFQQNPGMFLGTLVWYSVPESVWADYNDFTANAIVTDAPVQIRKAPKASDVFLRACTTVENNYRRQAVPQSMADSGAAYANYLIRKAGSDSDWVCKQIVAEYVDLSDHQLSFSVLADLRFNKNSHKLIMNPTLEGSLDSNIDNIRDSVLDYYAQKEMLLTPYTIREAFRRALEGPMMALSVRSAGGVYFVSETQNENLAAMEKLANLYDGVSFHVLPLIDDGQQREMLRTAFTDDSVGELEKLMGEIQEVLDKKGSLTTKQLVAFQERYDEYRNRTKEYSTILDDSLETASAALTLCKQSIKQAFTKVSD